MERMTGKSPSYRHSEEKMYCTISYNTHLRVLGDEYHGLSVTCCITHVWFDGYLYIGPAL